MTRLFSCLRTACGSIFFVGIRVVTGTRIRQRSLDTSATKFTTLETRRCLGGLALTSSTADGKIAQKLLSTCMLESQKVNSPVCMASKSLSASSPALLCCELQSRQVHQVQDTRHLTQTDTRLVEKADECRTPRTHGPPSPNT